MVTVGIHCRTVGVLSETVGVLSEHCRSTVGTEYCRSTVGNCCRTVGPWLRRRARDADAHDHTIS